MPWIRRILQSGRDHERIWLLCNVLVILSGVFLCCGCTDPEDTNPVVARGLQITDSEGTLFTFTQPINRIISLNDDATEMLVTIGAKNTLVGVTGTAKNSTLLADDVENATNVGDWLTPNVETMVLLRPDLIIGYSTAKPRNIELITAAKLPIVYIDCYRLARMNEDAKTLGVITNHEANASRYVEFNNKYLDLIQKRVHGRNSTSPLKVYFESYTDHSLMTTRSAGGQILEYLSVPNMYGNYSSDWVTVDSISNFL